MRHYLKLREESANSTALTDAVHGMRSLVDCVWSKCYTQATRVQVVMLRT